MKRIFYFFTTAVCIFFSPTFSFAADNIDSLQLSKSHFHTAKSEIIAMLCNVPLDYERAVFLTENAYWENAVSYDGFQKLLHWHTERIKDLMKANDRCEETEFKPLPHETVELLKKRYQNTLANWAIFTYMTDTTLFALDTNLVAFHLPYNYSKHDPLGSDDWSNTQIFSLLNPESRTGNCYALANLYKIFADRISAETWIATAPGHIYIVHADDKGALHNIDLGTQSFPGTGSMQTITSTTKEAIQNSISMNRLDARQSVALSLVYLAKGYEYKFGSDDDFILECAEAALEFDSLNLQGMLLKAQVMEEKLLKESDDVEKIRSAPETENLLRQYQKLLVQLYKLGYREMPANEKAIVLARIKGEPLVYSVNHESQPFKSLGINTRSATISGGLFQEVFEKKEEERFGRTVVNVDEEKVVRFVDDTANVDVVLFGWSVDPLAHKMPGWSPYAAFFNNPIRYVDPDGRFPIDIFADAVFIAYDIYDIAKTKLSGGTVSKTQYAALGADIVGAVIPGATGLGMTVRAGKTVDKVVDAEKIIDKVNDAQKALPEKAGPVGNISPSEVINKTPDQIDIRAKELGLEPKGPDPKSGKGSYIDPQTEKQRILSHPNDPKGAHGHVNSPEGQRIDNKGNVVDNKSKEGHLPIRIE